MNRRPPPPAPLVIDDEMEYEVEEIVDSRIYYNRLQYLVKWLGYDHYDNSWQSPEDVQHAKELVAEFHQKYPSKPKEPPSRSTRKQNMAKHPFNSISLKSQTASLKNGMAEE